MTHSAKILAHSISPDGVPLATMEVVFPRIVLAEFNTHRMLSRNSASSRAIPVEKMISMVREHPYVPTEWPKNQKGMSASENITNVREAEEIWLMQRDEAVKSALGLLRVGAHKQITNRLLEPFMWHTVIVTATEWDNFFHLRCHPAAHPEIRKVAELMRDALAASTPKMVDYDRWHMPLIDPKTDEDVCTQMRLGISLKECREILCKISVGRCARVSYLTHDGKRDLQADIDLHDALLKSGHMSPFEHVARPVEIHRQRDLASRDFHCAFGRVNQFPESVTEKNCWFGNFRGWVPYRKTIPGESDMLAAAKAYDSRRA